MPDRSTRAGASSGSRCSPRSRIRPGPCCSARTADTAPGVGQVPGGPLVVGQASPGDGGHGGGHALVVSDELGGREAVLAGPLIPVAEPEGLGEQRPLGRQPPGLAGPLPDGGLLGMAAGLPSAQPPGQAGSRPGWRCRRPGPAAATGRRGWPASAHPSSRVHRGRRRRAISSPSQQRSTSSPSPSSARSGQRAAGVPAGRARRAAGLLDHHRPHQPATPSATATAGAG